ncbi:radical SAM protein [Paraliomyxa miuraensis]|uniref:radical SAM protein n=1 Tax=Paraliomyxa miuraensis TaxID=376150 RepID=UPI00224D7AFE|nr:radical SAM protein [Paraliomyxa miuraensis]MCX4239412.1 radical SAM protein [Paraliomyxa miuraensis]
MSPPWDPSTVVELPRALASMRRFELDGALLLFDRDTGLCARCDGPETAHLRQRAPRFVQLAITNRCNLACAFCYRDRRANSAWTPESAFELLRDLAEAGVLEVAFGGGEPFAFPGMAELVCRLYEQTPLAVNLTTNGLLLTTEILRQIAGKIGQLRLSLYEDNDWPATVARLVEQRTRFGINYLVTPARLPRLEVTVLDLVARGCRDVLLLSYNGHDHALHLGPTQARDLAQRVRELSRALRGRCGLKLDVCWGERMETVPRLLDPADCGAGVEFVALTSDRMLRPCSYHHLAFPIESAQDVLRHWSHRRTMLTAARDPGCARLAHAGLGPPPPHGALHADSLVERLRQQQQR